jgi:hypothetical protein
LIPPLVATRRICHSQAVFDFLTKERIAMRFFTTPVAQRRQHRGRPFSLNLLVLEDRTVPSSVTIVPVGVTPDNVTTFATLADALPAAGPNGLVTIDHGAPSIDSTSFPVVNQASLTIQGQPGVFVGDLPAIALEVNADGVVLKNLNLTSVTFDGGIGNATVARSVIGNLAFLGGNGSGHNTITGNSISGMLFIDVPPTDASGGGSGGVAPTGQYPSTWNPGNTGDQIVDNAFTGISSTMLHVNQDNGLLVQYNSFAGSGSNQTTGGAGSPAITGAPQTAMRIEASQGVLIANNTVGLPGDTAPAGAAGTFTALVISQGAGNQQASSGTIRNNVLTAGSTGIGLDLNSAANASNPDAQTNFRIEGNNFHDDGVGVRYTGSGGSTLATDLGSASGSLGGNLFRKTTSDPATATDAAIVLTGVGNGATLTAWRNAGLFSSSVVFIAQPPGGTASIDLTGPLPFNWAYVQGMYNDLLARTGALTEVIPWANTYIADPVNGATMVTSAIANSDAALLWTINSYYLKFLGRTAETSGAQYWLSQVRAGLSLEGVQAGITSSPEFLADTSSHYVQGLYRAFLGRTGSAAELAYWQALLPTQGNQAVALGIAESAEAKGGFIRAAYQSYLHRAAGASEVSYWQGQGSEFSIQVGILSSQEYVYYAFA